MQHGLLLNSTAHVHPPDGGQGSCHVADLTSTVGKHDADGGENLQAAQQKLCGNHFVHTR
jgi:hypothetical protein